MSSTIHERATRCTLLFLHNAERISPQPYYAENLGIQYIASILRSDGFSVQVINCDYGCYSDKRLLEMITIDESGVLGMAPSYVTMDSALRIACLAKEKYPGLIVCLGGHHATFCSEDILKFEKDIDVIVRGEGETTTLELLRAIEANGGKMPPERELQRIRGLSFRLGQQVVQTPSRPLVADLDSIPFPVRDPLDALLVEGKHAMPLLCTSRGCPANCTFCSTPAFYGRRWRGRSAENVVDEIETIVNRYGYSQFYLTDDQFAGHGLEGRQHVLSLIEEIDRRQLAQSHALHFFLMLRADFVCADNLDVIQRFPSVGFRDVFLGFESASSSELERYAKGVRPSHYPEAVRLLRQCGIFVEGGFIIFNPYSNWATLRQDASFIHELGVPLFGYYTKELMALPGTRLFASLVDDGLMLTHSYRKIEFIYKDSCVAGLLSFLKESSTEFETIDNRLFQAIDFYIKLEGLLPKLSDNSVSHEAAQCIKASSVVCRALADLNYEFFIQLLDSFQHRNAASHCERLKHQFLERHHVLSRPVLTTAWRLNEVVPIIKHFGASYQSS